MVLFVPAIEDAKATQAHIAAQSAQLAQTRAAFVPAQKLQGVAMRVTLKHNVTDVKCLPSSLTIVTANDAEIRKIYCAGWKEGDPVPTLPGVTFIIDRNPVPTGFRR